MFSRIVRRLQSASSCSGLPYTSWEEQWTHRALCKFCTHFLSGKLWLKLSRKEFPRGSVIGEFVGLITKGMVGMDVMQSGHEKKQYQIYQGQMGPSIWLSHSGLC